MRNIASWLWVIFIACTPLLGCTSLIRYSSLDSSREIIHIDGDLLIDSTRMEFQYVQINIAGDVIVENGGELLLFNSVVNIISSHDEEFGIKVTGDSSLRAYDSLIQGVDYQFGITAEEENGESPYLSFDNTTVTFHYGIQAFNNTIVVAYYSDIEEIQVHDNAEVSIIGGNSTYPVFFFEDDQVVELYGLVTDVPITRTIRLSGGWVFKLRGAVVDGYQIDVYGDSRVTLKNCEGITASIHTPGNLGSGEVLVENVTTTGRDDGSYLGLGPVIIYKNTSIDLFNIYVTGKDHVRINRGVVNEADSLESSKLTISNCTMEYNLVQSYDNSELNIVDCAIDNDYSYIPTATAKDTSRMTLRNSDCRNLRAQAIDNAEIQFFNAGNLDEDNLSIQDKGKIFVDGRQVTP